jgi:hypothetical protein
LPRKTFAQKDICPEDVCPEDVCPEECLPRRHLPRKTFAKKDICPEDVCPQEHLPRKTIAQKDICPERHLARKTITQKDFCPERQLPRNTFAQITIACTIINQKYIYQKYNLLYKTNHNYQLLEHLQMLISVLLKNRSAFTPYTSLPLSQALFLSLSLSAATALRGINANKWLLNGRAAISVCDDCRFNSQSWVPLFMSTIRW